MRNVPTLLRRELNAYFASVMGYVVLMLFLLVMGFTFAYIVSFLNRGPTPQTALGLLFSMFWLPTLMVIPVITMRLLAEEKRAGTIEMLMTAPVTDFEVVFAKFLGAVVLYTLMWALTAFYVLILWHFSDRQAVLDLGPIASGYLGVLLIGQFLIAVGILASSLTKNQVAAALISFALVFFLLIGVLWLGYSFQGGPLGKLLRYVSPFDHMTDFSRGLVDLRAVAFYLGSSAWALLVTTRVVESRKWR